MIEPYRTTYLTHSNDHNTEVLIGAISEILRALETISLQLDELNKKIKESSKEANNDEIRFNHKS